MAREWRRFVVGKLRLDNARFEVFLGGTEVRVTQSEFALLWALASEAGRVFRRRELLLKVWGPKISVGPRTVDAHIKKLRKKLRSVPDGSSVIETVRGVGYRLRS